MAPTMANTHLAYPDLAIDKVSGTDPDQDAESFVELIERKTIFALREAPRDAGELANYTFRKKALFCSILRGPTAEWYENNITTATTWENVRTNFVTRFSDGRNKFRYRLEVEDCIRRNGEKIRNFIHCIKRTVNKGWPDDMNDCSTKFRTGSSRMTKKTEIYRLLAQRKTIKILTAKSTRTPNGKP